MIINILIFGFFLPLYRPLIGKQAYVMNFEEIDGVYDSDGKLINNTEIMSATFSQEINDTFKYVNNVEFDENQSLWIIDIDSQEAVFEREKLKNFNFNMDKELNDSINESNFPSFYKFIRERELKEISEKEEYLRKAKINAFNISKAINESKANYLRDAKNKALNITQKLNEKNEKNQKKIERYEDFEPTSKDLKILSSFSAIEWTRTWIYEMLHVPDFFPTFMFQDMFLLRDFGQKNNSKNYFYIGYYPSDINLKNGPFYIGAFELVPKMREFRTHILVQNPYYCTENVYDENKIKNFKKELMAMCNDATVFFKFSNLQNTSEQRYYYSWLYEE
jgi:hypothetical protein